jgi:hypothetical protein
VGGVGEFFRASSEGACAEHFRERAGTIILYEEENAHAEAKEHAEIPDAVQVSLSESPSGSREAGAFNGEGDDSSYTGDTCLPSPEQKS